MSDSVRPDIGLFFIEGTPPSWVTEFETDISSDGLEFVSSSHSGGPYAGIALYLPTAIGIFIASSYFGGAFKKLGEEHYNVVKNAAIKLWKRAESVHVSAAGPAAKLRDFERYQLSYSISCASADRLVFKLILRMGISDTASEEAILTFLDTVRDIHLGEINPAVLDQLMVTKSVGGIIVLTFDPDTFELIPAD